MRRTSLERSKNSAGEVVALLASPQPSGGQRWGSAGGRRGGLGGRTGAGARQNPGPAESDGAEVEPSPLKAMRGSWRLQPLFPVGSLSPGGRGLRPVPVPRRPGEERQRAVAWRRNRSHHAPEFKHNTAAGGTAMV